MTQRRQRRLRRRRTVGLAFVAVLLAVAVGLPAGGSSVSGSAGVAGALPSTDSALTVAGRGQFSGLRIKVNQTENLLNQAISVSWTGLDPTSDIGGQFGQNYLQMMQCWGDDDGTNPDNPGPPPEHCVFGAKNAVYGGISGSPFPPGSFTTERIISRAGWPNFDPAAGVFDARTGNLWREFVSVGGTVIGNHIDPAFNPSGESGVYWQNPFFNIITSNEVAGARTLDNGTGSEFFEVVTGIENNGLGCGQQVEPVAGGGTRVPKCWLVIVPRGDAESENEGTPFGSTSGVVTSPLAPEVWKNRIAVPLAFNPVDTACRLGDDTRRLAGTELVLGAVSSWQPVLCGTPGLKPYSYSVVSDSGARQQLASNTVGAPGMYVVSRPMDDDDEDSTNPTVYAPLTLSGITIGFNIERGPGLEADGEARRLAGVRLSTLNLTPRLVAKLLTQSYTRQVNIQRLPSYAWLASNPDHMGDDPDFLRFNPEFRELEIVWRKHFSGLMVPAGASDAARTLWEYVLADPEARSWLEGGADAWGMVVNPAFAGIAAEALSTYPKNDPYCYQAPKTPQGVTPPVLCGNDWNPYTQSMRDGAKQVRSADDGARLEENSFAPTPSRYYGRTPPQPPGRRTILALTDSPSASLFGLQTARLSRAGDNGDARTFISPDTAGLTAAISGMVPKGAPTVREPDPAAQAAGGYPLTMLTYAAIRPLALSAEERSEYAAFLDYAAGPGQVSGLDYGELPRGYAPLPPDLREQARIAAKTVRELTSASESVAEPLASVEPAAEGTAPRDEIASDSPGVDLLAATRTARRASAAMESGAGNDSLFATPVAANATVEPANDPIAREVIALARTPGVAVPASRHILPALAVVLLLSVWGGLEVTKRPRRAPGADRR